MVEDVAWHCTHSDYFASVGDDKKLIVYVVFTYLVSLIPQLLFKISQVGY